MAPLTRGFAHLRVKETPLGTPDLTIHIWDGSLAEPRGLLGYFLEPFVRDWRPFLNPRGQINLLHQPPVVALYHPGPDLLSVTDTTSAMAYYWKRDAAPIPYYEEGSPMRALLHAWLRSRGCQFVHAAAMGTPKGGLLLAGKGGSGKSTTALACLGSGLQYAADDYCLATMAGQVHSLFNTVKLVGERDLQRFPALRHLVANQERPQGDKAMIFLEEHHPDQIISHFPLRAILTPRITGQPETWIEPAKASDAVMALAPTTLAQLPASGDLDMRQMAQLARLVPTFRLNLGTEIQRIPGILEQFLETLPA